MIKQLEAQTTESTPTRRREETEFRHWEIIVISTGFYLRKNK